MITPGYITMQEAIEATPLSYLANRALLPNLLQILVLFLTVLFDPYILKKQSKFMFAIIALELSLIGQDLISAYLNTHNLPPLLRPKPRRTPGSGNVDASYLRTLRKDLNDTFTAAGCADVLINAWQRRGVRTDLVDCDYYDWKKGKPRAINAYRGEYMTQYSWAEITHGALEYPEK